MTNIADDFEINFANRRIMHTAQKVSYDVNNFYQYLTSTLAIGIGRYYFTFTWWQWRFSARRGQSIYFGPFSVFRAQVGVIK